MAQVTTGASSLVHRWTHDLPQTYIITNITNSLHNRNKSFCLVYRIMNSTALPIILLTARSNNNATQPTPTSTYATYCELKLIWPPCQPQNIHKEGLVDTLERWDSLALLLIQSVVHDGTVRKVDLSLRLLPRESVLLPVLVISVWVILAGVCTTRLLPVRCCLGGLHAINYVSNRPVDDTVVKLTRRLTSS